jgi:heat shock protein HslJ
MRARLPLLAALLALTVSVPASAQPARTPTWRIGDDLAGTRWRAESIKGVPVADPSEATLEFIPGDHVRGQAACNRFVGPYASRSDRINLGPLRVSRLDCGDDGEALQNALIVELRRANRVVLTKDRLELLPSRGPATVFARSP